MANSVDQDETARYAICRSKYRIPFFIILIRFLFTGDRVSIENDRVASIYGQAYSSFSGFLVSEINSCNDDI